MIEADAETDVSGNLQIGGLLRHVAKDSLLTLVARVVVLALHFGSGVLIARSLGPEEQGYYAMIALVVLLAAELADLGLNRASVYFIGRGNYDPQQVVGSSLVLLALTGGVITVLVLGVSVCEPSLLFGENNVPGVLIFGIGIVPIWLLARFTHLTLTGFQDIGRYNLVVIATSAAQFSGLAIALGLGRLQLGSAMAVSFLKNFLQLALCLYFLNQHVPLKLSWNPRYIVDGVRYGGKVYLAILTKMLADRLDFFILGHFLTVADIGIYSIATTLVAKLWEVPSAVGLVLFPTLSSVGEDQMDALTPKVTRHVAMIVFLSAVAFAPMAPWFVVRVYSSQYRESILPLLLMLPGIVVGAPIKTLSSDLKSRGRPEADMASTMVALVVTVVLDLAMIPAWGMAGAALVTSLAWLARSVYLMVVYTRLTSMSVWKVILPQREDWAAWKVRARMLARRCAQQWVA